MFSEVGVTGVMAGLFFDRFDREDDHMIGFAHGKQRTTVVVHDHADLIVALLHDDGWEVLDQDHEGVTWAHASGGCIKLEIRKTEFPDPAERAAG